MLIYLVRHGQTDYNKDRRCQGWVDIPLNATGRAQAEALGAWFAQTSIAAVYASPLVRARVTAEAIASRHALSVHACDGLKELHQGELDGLTSEELARGYPELLAAWFRQPAEVVMPGGESLLQTADRACSAIADIRARHRAGDTVVVVSHKLTVLTVLCRAVGASLNHFRRFELEPGALISLRYQGSEPTLVRYNEAPGQAACPERLP